MRRGSSWTQNCLPHYNFTFACHYWTRLLYQVSYTLGKGPFALSKEPSVKKLLVKAPWWVPIRHSIKKSHHDGGCHNDDVFATCLVTDTRQRWWVCGVPWPWYLANLMPLLIAMAKALDKACSPVARQINCTVLWHITRQRPLCWVQH
jgi:hypothetical protein